MDSNEHSGIWGCDDNNSRGEEVKDLLDEYELTVSNVGNAPSFSSNQRRTNNQIDHRHNSNKQVCC